MGDEVTQHTPQAILEGLTSRATQTLENSLEREKEATIFSKACPPLSRRCEMGRSSVAFTRAKSFTPKPTSTTRKSAFWVRALVGSSNFTAPGLSDNIELNINIKSEVDKLQAWFEAHWEAGSDISPEVLRTIERHTAPYAPLEVYARALRELLKNHIPDVEEWEKTGSKIFPHLAKYQQDGYASLMQIARNYGGALLCDGVGLGKTFVGMMVIERLLRDRKKVVLFAPKAAVDPVWTRILQAYLPGAFGEYSDLKIYAHTDLDRQGARGAGQPSWEETWAELGEKADAILIDEAHHFRNPGSFGSENKRESRYRRMARLCQNKQVFLLTATPINNSLRDFQHMIELFTGGKNDFFAPKFGIHSLPDYFGELEKKLARQVAGAPLEQLSFFDLSEWEAEPILREDKIFSSLVVQRSRAYARQSQIQEAQARGQSGDFAQIFPRRQAPRVAEYSIKKSYGKILKMVEDAFDKEKPLFALGIYYPFFYAKDDEKARLLAFDKRVQNQQQQVVGLIRTNFLKRFESSTRAFEVSCARLFLKIFDWVEDYVEEEAETKRLERFRRDNAAVLQYLRKILPDAPDLATPKAARPLSDKQKRALEREAQSADDAAPETETAVAAFPRDKYKIELLLEDCFNDLLQLAAFLRELSSFKAGNDDKLRRLKELLHKDLKGRKVLIFTQFSDTARYLQSQLEAAGIEGVDEIDSGSTDERGEIIRRFAPYYNGSSSPALQSEKLAETRVLISTDVLSEGLNLQDATRLVNYDIHWNPVRLMQRIGRVDRRMNPQIETQMIADNPALAFERGDNNTVIYWNFLPPEELEELIKIYNRVAHKTLRISKTLGIETGKLLRPEDQYDELRELTHQLDGEKAPLEDLSLEWQTLLAQHPGLAENLDQLPARLFSGQAHPAPGSRAVFFCYVLPTKNPEGQWTHEGGPVKWLLFDLDGEKVLDTPAQIAGYVRATPQTPRRVVADKTALAGARRKVEKSLKKTIGALEIPLGQNDKPLLRCWMELS